VIQYRYDGDDNLTQIVAPGNTVSRFNYDADGNLVSSSNPLGHQVNYTYEPNFNQLASVSDPKGNAIGYGYDNRGNLTNITYADGSSETFGYDSNGNLTISANRRGQTLQYTYDANFRLIQKDYPNGSSATFTYDDRGNLLTATDGDSSTSFAYDSNDRLIQVTDSDGRFLSYTYDDIGRRTQMTDSLGNQVNYSYDSLGRLSRLTDGSNNLIAAYTYDAVGQLSRNDNGNGTYTTYSYDPAGQLISLANYKADGSINSRFDYTYNELGQQTSMTTLEGTTNYGYDASGQLTSVSLPDQRSIQYEYDEVGNRIKVTDSGTTTDYSTNNLNQYTAVGGATYRYDTDGNLIEKTEAGNTSTYIYDAENRLTGVTTPEGSWSYEYDALGNRVATVRNGERTEYLLDPIGLGNVVAEFDESGNLVANYVHGLGLESHTRQGSQTFYDFDAIGSVTGLTGDAGDYLNQYSYLPFGENLTKTESIANPFEYVGQWGVMNEENGLEFMRARFYDSQDGRFTQPDPIGVAGGINLYGYTQNSPTIAIDPSGLVCNDLVNTLNTWINTAGGLATGASVAASAAAKIGIGSVTVAASAAWAVGVGIGNIINDLTGADTQSRLSGGLFGDLAGLAGAGDVVTGIANITDLLVGLRGGNFIGGPKLPSTTAQTVSSSARQTAARIQANSDFYNRVADNAVGLSGVLSHLGVCDALKSIKDSLGNFTDPLPILGGGDIQVTLRWRSQDDLDLAVTASNGERVDYTNRSVPSGGALDRDTNAACQDPTTSRAVENIFWPDQSASVGSYIAEVNLFQRCENSTGSIPFRLSISTINDTFSFDGVVNDGTSTIEFPFIVNGLSDNSSSSNNDPIVRASMIEDPIINANVTEEMNQSDPYFSSFSESEGNAVSSLVLSDSLGLNSISSVETFGSEPVLTSLPELEGNAVSSLVLSDNWDLNPISSLGTFGEILDSNYPGFANDFTTDLYLNNEIL
jgi:RHS repeat-associated protein